MDTVGLSTDHQLVIRWRCTRCDRIMHIGKPLAQCWRDSPKDEQVGLQDSEAISDRGFLRDIGIKGDGDEG